MAAFIIATKETLPYQTLANQFSIPFSNQTGLLTLILLGAIFPQPLTQMPIEIELDAK